MSKFKQVRVIWDDAEADMGWDVIPEKLEYKLVTTIGFLILETKTHMLIAGSVGHGDEDCNNRIQIPKAMVKKVEKIKDGATKRTSSVGKVSDKRGKNARVNSRADPYDLDTSGRSSTRYPRHGFDYSRPSSW